VPPEEKPSRRRAGINSAFPLLPIPIASKFRPTPPPDSIRVVPLARSSLGTGEAHREEFGGHKPAGTGCPPWLLVMLARGKPWT
jgi:hypothetical protein